MYNIGGTTIATVSFDRALIIDSDETAKDFIKALDAADARGPLECSDISEDIRRGDEVVKRGIRL